jgi:hypothetical protein
MEETLYYHQFNGNVSSIIARNLENGDEMLLFRSETDVVYQFLVIGDEWIIINKKIADSGGPYGYEQGDCFFIHLPDGASSSLQKEFDLEATHISKVAYDGRYFYIEQIKQVSGNYRPEVLYTIVGPRGKASWCVNAKAYTFYAFIATNGYIIYCDPKYVFYICQYSTGKMIPLAKSLSEIKRFWLIDETLGFVSLPPVYPPEHVDYFVSIDLLTLKATQSVGYLDWNAIIPMNGFYIYESRQASEDVLNLTFSEIQISTFSYDGQIIFKFPPVAPGISIGTLQYAIHKNRLFYLDYIGTEVLDTRVVEVVAYL